MQEHDEEPVERAVYTRDREVPDTGGLITRYRPHSGRFEDRYFRGPNQWADLERYQARHGGTLVRRKKGPVPALRF